ncbi:FAD-dependent oxidoreductase, partial [Candidatus Saccharibacteria bacterium]|nr:FAD-dependent oxidoreductase [Candidatus Saccharibacteria bacterium]
MSKHNIVIVGGGFGGIKAALELTDDRRFHVTLLSDQADFRFYPTLFRTATGGRRMISSIPLSEIFAGKSVHIVNDSIKSLDRQERRLKTTKGHGFT